MRLNSVDQLLKWVEENKEHPLASTLADEAMLCKALQALLHNHLLHTIEELKLIKEESAIMLGSTPFAFPSLEDEAIAIVKSQLMTKGNSPEAVKLSMCDHDLDIYDRIRNSVDYCVQLLNSFE